MYIPEYLKIIQADVNSALEATESALIKIENSEEYTNHLHPFHAAAVATYNKLTTLAITLDGFDV